MTTQTAGTDRPTYYECGFCSSLHSVTFAGDCRQDDARFMPEDLDARHGPFNWDEIDMEDVDTFLERHP